MSLKHFEDYVKAIYLICVDSETATARTGTLARRIGVTESSVSSMIRNLAEAGLVVFTPYEGVQLTDPGRLLAMRVLRRYRLIVLLFMTLLDVDSTEAQDEAELLEHVISERLTDRIDNFLGHPLTDAHGSPIPKSDGSFPEDKLKAISDVLAPSVVSNCRGQTATHRPTSRGQVVIQTSIGAISSAETS